jgi:hypothetical protein
MFLVAQIRLGYKRQQLRKVFNFLLSNNSYDSLQKNIVV